MGLYTLRLPGCRLIQVGIAQRIEELQIHLPEMKIPCAHLLDTRILRYLVCGNRIRSEQTSPLRAGVLSAGEHLVGKSFHKSEVAQNPQRVASSFFSRKRQWNIIDLCQGFEHGFLGKIERESNCIFRVHSLLLLDLWPRTNPRVYLSSGWLCGARFGTRPV